MRATMTFKVIRIVHRRTVRDADERTSEATWRDAACVVALERLSAAHEARGLWPRATAPC
jgi:glutamate dehydrogenase/leucine dehydrogenase